MSDTEEIMKMYKEIQENYIKALERENEELRKQREKDSLRIEELEKEILVERGNKYIKNVPGRIDDQTIIGPGNGWGYQPNHVWTTNNTTPVTLGGTAANPTYTSNSSYNDSVKMYKEEYEKMKEYQSTLGKLQKEVEDDN